MITLVPICRHLSVYISRHNELHMYTYIQCIYVTPQRRQRPLVRLRNSIIFWRSTRLRLHWQFVYNVINESKTSKSNKNAMNKQWLCNRNSGVCYDVYRWSYTWIVPLVLCRSYDVSPLRASSGREVHCLTQADGSMLPIPSNKKHESLSIHQPV